MKKQSGSTDRRNDVILSPKMHMPEWMRALLWILLIPAGMMALYLAGVILAGIITAYSPPGLQAVDTPKPCTRPSYNADTVTFVTWNIGYAGLGKEMDFFYEGGHQVRPDKDRYVDYIQGILNGINRLGEVDFFLFQEVDKQAKRSYGDNQVERIQKQLPAWNGLYTPNYKVRFVPLPLLRPMGPVHSGLFLAGRYCPEEAWRHGVPPDESWPTRLFMLNRCFLRARFTVNNKPITVINTHHSAYDETGEAKAVQLAILREAALKAFENGSLVIIGGDWNQNPPDYDPHHITNGDLAKAIRPPIPAGWMPDGWKWVYDPEAPTNRDVHRPYIKGITPTTIIDFFLVSPNIEVLEIKTLPMDFGFSDHQPVYMKVRLTGQ